MHRSLVVRQLLPNAALFAGEYLKAMAILDGGDQEET